MNQNETAPTGPLALAPVPAAESVSERRFRVLAVDDQRDSLRLLQILLQSAGFECLTSPGGSDALELLERETVDVILLDVMMPDINGFELCQKIKANPRTNDIPILFLTAHLGQEDKIRGLEVGGHDYLNKPVNREELIARTRAALRVKELQDRLKHQIQLEHQVNQLLQERLSEHWLKTLGQLAASLAHEINNPLAVALGTVQLLSLNSSLGDEALEHLRIVDSSLQRVGQKLRSLLLIAQPAHSSERVALAELTDDLVALINFQLVVQRVRLVTHLDRSCYWNGSAGALARALLYVLNNAVEAVARRPGASVVVALDCEDGNPRIRISDTGAGIPPELRDRVFEPFFTTKKPPHTGVGLYLAREIIQSFNGTIDLAREPTLGQTEFSVRLTAPEMF